MSQFLAEQNRNLISKKVDSFYVSFYMMPENVQNILGRQVKSIERPTIQFNQNELFNKGIKRTGNNKIDFQAISVIFADDDRSLVQRSLMDQVKKQNGIGTPREEAFENAKFEIGVKVHNAEEDIVEQFTLKRCFIITILNSEAIYAESTDNVITVTVQFDDVDYVFPELQPTAPPLSANTIVDEFGDAIVDEFGDIITA